METLVAVLGPYLSHDSLDYYSMLLMIKTRLLSCFEEFHFHSPSSLFEDLASMEYFEELRSTLGHVEVELGAGNLIYLSHGCCCCLYVLSFH